MATLTSEDFTKIKQIVAGDADKKAIFKALNLTKATWYTVFQALEDWEVDGHTSQPTESRDAALEAAAGKSVTIAQGTAIFETWVSWRFSV